MSDPLFPAWAKLALFGGTATAIWTITGLPPAPWWARILYYCFLLSMVYVVSQAVAALHPELPPGAYGVVGALVPVVIINLLIWLRKASSDPIGTLKAALQAWRGGSNGS